MPGADGDELLAEGAEVPVIRRDHRTTLSAGEVEHRGIAKTGERWHAVDRRRIDAPAPQPGNRFRGEHRVEQEPQPAMR